MTDYIPMLLLFFVLAWAFLIGTYSIKRNFDENAWYIAHGYSLKPMLGSGVPQFEKSEGECDDK